VCLDQAERDPAGDCAGQEPSPPSIIASMPFSVDHMPSIGVTCSLPETMRKPVSPPIAEARAKTRSETPTR